MTFLEFVCRRLLGKPSGGSWRCPVCEKDGLTVRPPKGKYPIKWKCWKCESWGDEFDLVKELFPGEAYPRRGIRVGRLREEFEESQPEPLDTSPGRRGVRRRLCVGGIPVHQENPSTEGVEILWQLMNEGEVDWDDLLEVIGELNHARNLAVERAVLGKKTKTRAASI